MTSDRHYRLRRISSTPSATCRASKRSAAGSTDQSSAASCRKYPLTGIIRHRFSTRVLDTSTRKSPGDMHLPSSCPKSDPFSTCPSPYRQACDLQRRSHGDRNGSHSTPTTTINRLTSSDAAPRRTPGQLRLARPLWYQSLMADKWLKAFRAAGEGCARCGKKTRLLQSYCPECKAIVNSILAQYTTAARKRTCSIRTARA
jgi:hypothetical protein